MQGGLQERLHLQAGETRTYLSAAGAKPEIRLIKDKAERS